MKRQMISNVNTQVQVDDTLYIYICRKKCEELLYNRVGLVPVRWVVLIPSSYTVHGPCDTQSPVEWLDHMCLRDLDFFSLTM